MPASSSVVAPPHVVGRYAIDDALASGGVARVHLGRPILVGTFGESSDATGVNNDPSDTSANQSGAAYVASALASALFLLALAISGCSEAHPSPLVATATQPASMPLQSVALPPRGPLLVAGNAGSKGAANAGWSFPTAPHEGVDAIRITFTPESADRPPHAIYWAFQGAFLDNSVWYMGLQPDGQYGKTALFSVFGSATTPLAPSCKSGADNGAGTSCHIPYTWTFGHPYQLMARLVSGDTATLVYEGAVGDLTTGTITVIGDFSVAASRGLFKATGVTFEEYFKHYDSCSEVAHSEVLVYAPIAYRSGQEFPGALHSTNANNGCLPQFFGDGKTYVYMNNGR